MFLTEQLKTIRTAPIAMLIIVHNSIDYTTQKNQNDQKRNLKFMHNNIILSNGKMFSIVLSIP